ncbi:GTPase domain-containing protein [Herbaspirillum sp. AP02]|uniref:GTPase domain-containing protein n=1 Tax=unclassified Herbaspirillum TaxID=2624150 RepID=UPI0015DA59CD|nr:MULTISPECIES: GTPase domain-containing protein [unclassified Herbaspirillum]MBG7622106.1 GTPase domain-containing protein [Herbaspirillum sp. AP02]NZD69125.1 GTPase domain-containing protein [Herbaspirillum sp. AP21]
MAEYANELLKCANPECRISSGGRCIEGFDEASICPQFGRTPANSEVPLQQAASPKKTTIELSSAKALTIFGAQKILSDRISRVIAIIGPHDAGKTSLIAGLYDQFQAGDVDGIEFSRSQTLHSFEQVCHDARAESQREHPHTERTARGDVLFFHLDVINTNNKLKAAVLLGDRAGEEYIETRNDPDAAKKFFELSRADVIVMLVDGSKLLDNGLRHNIKTDVRLMLQAFLEAEVLRKWQRLAVVLTKMDEIRAGGDLGNRALSEFSSLVERLKENYAEYFSQIEGFQIAASPKTGSEKRGEGLSHLLAFWMNSALRYDAQKLPAITVTPERYFSRIRSIS